MQHQYLNSSAQNITKKSLIWPKVLNVKKAKIQTIMKKCGGQNYGGELAERTKSYHQPL